MYKFKPNPQLILSASVLLMTSGSANYVAAEDDKSLVLEEVIVTAQKREQDLQDVAISITALSSDKLEVNGVTDTDSIANLVPNLHIKEVEGGSVTYAIRGVSNNFATNIGFETAVGFYVDGIYQGKNYGTLFELGDVERIEVLRGPQGTLYGRNTIGGAINVVSKRPSGELGGKVKFGFGNSLLRYGSFSIDMPTWGSANKGPGEFRVRISGFGRERDGFTSNVSQGLDADGTLLPALPIGDFDRFGDIDRRGSHLAVDWEPRDNWKVTYDYTQTRMDDIPRLWQQLDSSVDAFASSLVGPYGAGSGQTWDTAQNFPDGASAEAGSGGFVDAATWAYMTSIDRATAVAGGEAAGLAAATDLADMYGRYVPSGNGIPSKGSSNADIFAKTTIKSHTASVSWNVGEFGMFGDITLKLMSAYRELDNSALIDLDGSDTRFYDVVRETETKQYSEEIQLVSTSENLNYTAGMFYFTEEGSDRRVTNFWGVVFPQSAFPENTNKAIFGQLDWSPSSLNALTLSVGARRTWEDKDMSRYVVENAASYLPQPEYVLAAENDVTHDLPTMSLSNTSYLFSPSYQITEDINVYYKYSEGFRSGGYDGSTTDRCVEATIDVDCADPTDRNWVARPFESEELDANEIGIKSRFLGGRIQVNAALFINDYTNMQLTEFNGAGVTHTINAGETELTGGEIEVDFLVTESLSGSLSYSSLDYTIDKFTIDTKTADDVDVSDVAEINNAPESTYNIALNYDFPKFSFGDLSLHINANYQDSSHAVSVTSTGGAPNSEVDDRTLVDARLTLAGIGTDMGDLQFALWGKNITDEEYIDNVIDLTWFRIGKSANPRTYGIEASLAF